MLQLRALDALEITGAAWRPPPLYCESFRKDFVRMPLELPVAVSVFKAELSTRPEVWGRRTYSKLFHWNEVPKGGHFAAFEQPELFVAALRKSFGQVRLSLLRTIELSV